MKRSVLAVIVLVVIGLGIAGAIWGGGDWSPGDHDAITRMVSQDGTETIVVHEGDRHFFPFGFLLFPLGFFFVLFLVRGFAFRGRWGRGGPWAMGGPRAGEAPGWFAEWHRRAHEGDGS